MNELDTSALADLYRDIFERDARGAVILTDLHNRFGKVRVITDGGIDAVLKTFKHNGQASVIGYVLDRIAQANGERPINGDEEGSPT